jgi:hypothetical protein
MAAFIVAETAIQEIARVTIIMILRIVVLLLWVLTAGQHWVALLRADCISWTRCVGLFLFYRIPL